MSTTQLFGVVTLVGTLLVAGMALGALKEQVSEQGRRIETLEKVQHYLHGDIDNFPGSK